MAVDVSVIIVNWNAGPILSDCLDSLPPALGNLTAEIRVVDNASADGSTAHIRDRFPDIRLQVNTTNVGFAMANNQAASQSHGRYLLLLNPDTRLPAGAIETLWRFAEADSSIGVLGPQLKFADGAFQRSCWRGF